MRKSIIMLVILVFLFSMVSSPSVTAAFNLNFSIDSDSLPPALQDIIKGLAGIQRIAVSGSFSWQNSKDWFFSGHLTVETVYGTAFVGDLSIRYLNGIVDWSLKFGSDIKIKIWSLGTKRYDVAFKKIPFIKHIDVGADVYVDMGGIGGLTNGEGQADVFIGLSVHAVLGFFGDKAEKSDASIDAHVHGRIHLVISFDGKYLRVGWYPEIGARAVMRVGKWFSWNWGDTWVPKDKPWPLYEYDVTRGREIRIRDFQSEDIPGGVYNNSDGGGTANISIMDAPDTPFEALDVGELYREGTNKIYVYPIYGSATVQATFKEGDKDYFKVSLDPARDTIIYLKPYGGDFDLYIYSPSGELYDVSWNGGETTDAVVLPKEKIASWGGTAIIGVHHYSGDGVYVVTVGLVGSHDGIYTPPMEIDGDIVGDGIVGPHYSTPNSSAWLEFRVNLSEGVRYKFTLEWDTSSDLDLYLYAPMTAPSIDGSGGDYAASSTTINKPEVIEYTVDRSGIWVIAIDHFSSTGAARFHLVVEIVNGTEGILDNNTYTPPCIINGHVEGTSQGPHYNSPNSPSWAEFRVELQAGTEYRISLSWNTTSDLDLYVYSPGDAPTEDLDGEDYYASAYTTNNPEILEFTPNMTGIWTIAVDHFSLEGSADFVMTIEIAQNQTNSTNGTYTILGIVMGDENVGPHYNDPSSPAWAEHEVYFEAGRQYKIMLLWDSLVDLDLYLYKPNMAPSQDGTGGDYYERAYTTNNPEVISFTADVSGEWTIAVDKYYGDSGSTEYRILIQTLNNTGGDQSRKFYGSISGDGSIGPHYGGNTIAWVEHTVYLQDNNRYRITLSWSGTSDLDLYVYAPGTSPSQDGDGEDYFARAYTTNKPEEVIIETTEDGEWVIAVDHYSASGVATYEITIEPVSESTVAGWEETVEKTRTRSITDTDRDGLSDYIENKIPIFDPDNALIPAIYPPIAVLVASILIFLRNRFVIRKKS